MGGWATDPFDNDLTYDFEGAFDACPEEEQEAMVREACEAAIAAGGRDEESARLTVTAAAWLTRAFPADEDDEPPAAGEPFADPAGLRALAVRALEAIAYAPPALVGGWTDAPEEEWRATLDSDSRPNLEPRGIRQGKFCGLPALKKGQLRLCLTEIVDQFLQGLGREVDELGALDSV